MDHCFTERGNANRRPMAVNLLKAGANLMVHNRSQGVVRELAGMGAEAATGLAQLASECDLVLVCLPNELRRVVVQVAGNPVNQFTGVVGNHHMQRALLTGISIISGNAFMPSRVCNEEFVAF